MPDELRLTAAFLFSLGAALSLTPLAIRVASSTGFYDHPRGYRRHAAPTAYLGGAAVVGSFVLAALLFTGEAAHYLPLLACALTLWAVGTLDDRMTVRPRYRVIAAVGAGTVLWATGLGWEFLASGFEEFLLTAIWVLAFTNAFNLMDNMDGAASSVATACAVGVAAMGLAFGDEALSVLALALAGACLGFLPYNLRSRGKSARIFLGDGGSMPLGFVLAAATMQVPMPDDITGWPVLLAAGLLLGIPVLDTLLVIVSRTRRGISLLTGGQDHVTHRLRKRLGSPRVVALALVVAQAGVSALAIMAVNYGRTATIVAALASLVAGAAVIALLEQPAWTTVSRSRQDALAEAVDV